MLNENLDSELEREHIPLMTPKELIELAQAAFGRSWKTILAAYLEVYLSTVNRWASGYTPISRQTEFAIRYACERAINRKEVA